MINLPHRENENTEEALLPGPHSSFESDGTFGCSWAGDENRKSQPSLAKMESVEDPEKGFSEKNDEEVRVEFRFKFSRN